MPPAPSLLEIFLVALRLGCTSFGGPVAHLAYFRREYVERKRWLDEAHYADLVALCQFLPGPASSQTGFGVGYLQRGFAGGLAAWLGFTLPSALLMVGFGYGVGALGDPGAAGWLKGLKAAAVAIVAHAVLAMTRSLCPDWPRRLLALGSAAVLLLWPATGSQIAVIAAGGVAGLVLGRLSPAAHTRATPASTPLRPTDRSAKTGAAVALGLFMCLLLTLPWVARLAASPESQVVDKFYRTGALVFGGGHVVLPLLEREVVDPGWLTHDEFLAGYGVAQAMPGPLFSFSAYLGTIMRPAGHDLTPSWRGGLLALGALFLPALLLVAGTLPYWQELRQRPRLQAAMRGANATVVGLLLAALITPVGTSGVTDLRSAALALLVLGGLWLPRVPVWALVAAAAGLGALAWPP